MEKKFDANIDDARPTWEPEESESSPDDDEEEDPDPELLELDEPLEDEDESPSSDDDPVPDPEFVFGRFGGILCHHIQLLAAKLFFGQNLTNRPTKVRPFHNRPDCQN